MTSVTSSELPSDYPRRIKDSRNAMGLTQAQFAELIGVSYASVNRWENSQSRPNNLAWHRIIELEKQSEKERRGMQVALDKDLIPAPSMDFSADPNIVSVVAEAHRLSYGHLFNSTFATETSLIDPLPHQHVAVYEHMLKQVPLRFLLADDAGAGKTIMTGLYVREMLSRRLIRRVLIVPPAGLVGNWEREMRSLFRLPFQIVSGSKARSGNPFLGNESNLIIVSIDTLAGDRLFGYLKDMATEPYDLVVFDEAHKLSASRGADFRVKKTDRYRLAEAIAGAGADNKSWQLHWSAQHLLLLTATPHMGKDSPYYFLWRLLLPDILSTHDAFDEFPSQSRQKHFIRRTKEEMVNFDGSPLYPQRNCDTLSYELSQGRGSEQELYDEITDYITHYYNKARFMNQSAARLAMSVFQRRLASSTYAIMRSLERRKGKLENLIDAIRNGRIREEHLARQQQSLGGLEDTFETRAPYENAETEDGYECDEEFENEVLGGTTAISLNELEAENLRVNELLDKARTLFQAGEESKFEKLREVLSDQEYIDEKFIIFTEHRDTAEFLFRRFESLGFTGRIAMIHGGLPYQEREKQVEFFRRPANEDGASYLVATDAAGEGINLQFCWLMVNYDIPWNPARLEQRMGRIHRYGQKHDPVIIVNLVAGSTREGQVLRTLLEKLEAMRRQLRSDKVFDVIGRLFENLPIRDYLEQALMEDADIAAKQLDDAFNENQIQDLEKRERLLFGEGCDLRQQLVHLKEEEERKNYHRLLPGYVRRFVEKAAPLLNLRVEGDLEKTFTLVSDQPRATDPLLPALESYSEKAQSRMTIYKQKNREDAIWVHPGEPVFECISKLILSRFGNDGLQGSVFIDPYASEPYLFHIAQVSIEQHIQDSKEQTALPGHPSDTETIPKLIESRLIGLRQSDDGTVEESPVERILLLRGDEGFAPSRIPLARRAISMASDAVSFINEKPLKHLVEVHRNLCIDDLPSRLELVNRAFGFKTADLAAKRSRLTERVRTSDPHAEEELSNIKELQRGLSESRDHHITRLKNEAGQIREGEVKFLVHALVVPSQEPEQTRNYDAEVEKIAVKVATAYEENFDAEVKDVSRPDLARRAGLSDWPGFDLLSLRPGNERRSIEVKGRAGVGEIDVSENEWAKACILREEYWLYVVFDCASPRPRLIRVHDPFRNLLVKSRGGVVIASDEVISAGEPELL